jgi:hypothetical protein
MRSYRRQQLIGRPGAIFGTVVAMMFALLQPTQAQNQPQQQSHDGLTLLPDSEVGIAYLDSDADLSGYSKIMILDCYVAFRKDWQKDHKKTGSHVSVSSHDMDRIKADTAALFREVFTEKLSEDGGYEIVNAAGPDVLLVRPAIIDLDIEAPDTAAGRSRMYTTTAGSATLFVELYDSVTGDILARAGDKEVARTAGGYLTYTNRVTNRSDARRILSRWAELLRDKLDELHGK